MKIWLGTSGFGRINDTEATKLIEKAINFGFYGIDTAPLYDDSEKKVGIALENLQTIVPISSKISREAKSLVDVRTSIEKTLEHLKMNTLSYCFIHSVPTEDYEKYLPALVKAMQDGLTQKLGYSGDEPYLLDAIKVDKFSCIMATLNILDQNNLGILHQGRKRELEIFVKRPLANSYFKFNSFQYLKFIQRLSRISKPNKSQLEYQRRYKQLRIDEKLTISHFINFQKYLKVADHVIVGVSSMEHLKKVHDVFRKSDINFELNELFIREWSKRAQHWKVLT